MKKILISLVLAFLLVVSISAADVLYEENFDKYTLAEGSNFNGWHFYKGKTTSTSTVTIEDGAMYFEANSAGYDIVYAEGLDFSNYTLEADVTFLKETGWFGMAYNVQSGKIWQKGTACPGTTKWSLNGYVSGWKNNTAGVNTGTYDNSILALNDTIRLRINTSGANATMSYAKYVDGVMGDWVELGSISNIPEGYQNGSVGFMMGANANNTTIKVDNITVVSNTDASVLYEENFDELALEKGENAGIGFTYYMKTDTSSTAIIKDGALHFHKDSTDGGYEMVYLTEGDYQNYTVEADFTYLAPTKESNGWAGLAFNISEYNTYFKSSLGMNNRVTVNGLVSNSWKYDIEGINKKDFETNISESGTYRQRIVTNKNNATLYYAFYNEDGTLGEYIEVMNIENIPSDMQSGTIGFNLARVVETNVIIDNIKVTANNYTFDKIADVYVPDTGIVNPAVVIEKVDSTLPLPDGKTPAVSLMEIDADMNILSSDGNVISNADEFMLNCSDVIIPAFVIDSESEAEALSEYLNSRYIKDAFVVADSDNAALVKAVRIACPTVRGALIFDDLSDDASCKAARALVSDSMSYIAIYDGLLDMDTVTYFNTRQITVWCYVADAVDVYTSIANGYNGVIADDASTVYDVYESITETTVSGKPVIIAHRGSRINTPENTLIAFREAVDTFGVKAIETDIRISSDGVCYLMHDSTVNRTTNGEGKGAEMTIAQIKALTVDEKANNLTVVPTWEEVVKEFAGTDIVFYCHINIRNDENVAEFCRIVDEYDFHDNVVFFISYGDRVTYNSENEIVSDGISFAAGDAPALVAGETDIDCVRMFIEGIVPYNYQPLFYDYDGYATESFYYQLSARGFLNYHSITNTQATLDSTLLTSLGSGGVLTDNIDLTDDYAFAIDVKDEIVYTGKNIDAVKTVLRITDNTVEKCGIIQLSGTPLAKTDIGYTLADENDAVIVYFADVKAGDSVYRVYSKAITLSFGGYDIYDVNNDGDFNLADAMIILKYFVNDNASDAYDATGDGTVNLVDIIRILKYVIE